MSSAVIIRRGGYKCVYSCSSWSHSNNSISSMSKYSEKRIVSKEVNESKSWPSILLVVLEKGKSNSPKAAVQIMPLIPNIKIDVNDLWADSTPIFDLFRKFSPSMKPNKVLLQMHFEKAIIDCRFFTLLAVAGSLVGSVLCFVEGCIMIMKSYLHTFSHRLDTSGIVQLVIEAIDMFLLGTAMLIFGMGLYVMFVKTPSNHFGFSSLQVPSWLKMHSLSQAKSRVGHAIMMILQVGVLEKFKNVALVTPLDLACFAAALLVSSTSLFLLSKLSSSSN